MLIFLSLISAAIAAPQLHPYYGNYGMYGFPMAGYPVANYPVANYPVAGYPLSGYPVRLYPGYPQQVAGGQADQRNLIKFGNLLEINGKFEELATATATVPASVIAGTFNIQQNGLFDIFSDNNAKFSMYIRSSTDLTGKNIKVNLATGADCVSAITAGLTELAMVNAPVSFNGFYITGTTVGYNIDGMNGKTTLKGATKWIVLTESGTTLGCSMAALQ